MGSVAGKTRPLFQMNPERDSRRTIPPTVVRITCFLTICSRLLFREMGCSRRRNGKDRA